MHAEVALVKQLRGPFSFWCGGGCHEGVVAPFCGTDAWTDERRPRLLRHASF